MMSASIPDNRKSRGRPETGIGKPVGLRLYPELERALDAYNLDQDDKPGRPEAIRRLLRSELSRLGYLHAAGAPDEGLRPDQLDATNDD